MEAKFDHERLDVYQLELQFVAWVSVLLSEVSKVSSCRMTEICDQLDRASLSILLNTAEGNGKRQRKIRAKFFDDARGSATESAACLDAVVAKGACARDRVSDGKDLLFRIVSMLTKLVDLFSDEDRVREESAIYQCGGVSAESDTSR